MTQVTLESLIRDGATLTEAQKGSLYRLVSQYCRRDTKAELSRRIDLPLVLWETHGIYGRVHVEGDGFSYCAGQSYPDEIRTLRQCILGGA